MPETKIERQPICRNQSPDSGSPLYVHYDILFQAFDKKEVPYVLYLLLYYKSKNDDHDSADSRVKDTFAWLYCLVYIGINGIYDK